MTIDNFSLISRIITLFFLGVLSHEFFRKKCHALGLFLFSAWFTCLRLALYRAVASYSGIFAHQDGEFVEKSLEFLLSANFTFVGDLMLLTSSVYLFFWVRKQSVIIKT